MTVLFAYLSAKCDAGFLCADNLEGNNSAKVDKVFLQWRRFAIGITGPEFLRDALAMIGWLDLPVNARYCDGQQVTAISSVQQLVRQLETTLPRIAKQQDKSFQDKLTRGVGTKEQYEIWSNQCGTFVVLDYVEKRLFELANDTCVSNLAAGIPPKFRSKGLPREQVFRFGGGASIATVTAEIVANPRAHAVHWIEQAATLTSNPLGALGASLTFSGSHVEFQSALNSVATC